MKSADRKWPPLVLAVFAFVVLGLFQAYSKQVESSRIADQDSRCAKQAAAPYVPFKGDLDCVGWKRIKSDIPMPIQG